MWGLFTRALTLAKSTVHVSVLNTGTNFLVAACAGALVFGERLPGLWWVGAALLVAGCLVIGAGREEGQRDEKAAGQQRQGRGQEEIPLLDRRSSDVDPGQARMRSPYLGDREELER